YMSYISFYYQLLDSTTPLCSIDLGEFARLDHRAQNKGSLGAIHTSQMQNWIAYQAVDIASI
ncbi:MAG: hypothetical protein ABJ364_08150, partial [Lentilitoribacter sp.]